LCVDLETLISLKDVAEEWLATVDLRLKPSKTRITHTLNEHEGNVGFDFLGFGVRQYHAGKHRTRTYRGKPGFKTIIQPSKKAIKRHHEKLGEVIRQHRGAPQKALIAAPAILNMAHAQGVTCYKRAFCALLVGQMALNLAAIGQNKDTECFLAPNSSP
jgi:RNA-directed DNA polymerase